MSYIEVGYHVIWNGEKFIVESLRGSGGLIVKSTERDFKTCVSKLSVTPVSKPEVTPKAPKPEPEVPYETCHTCYSKYNYKKCDFESFSVGDRVQVKLYGSQFLNGYGIYDGQIGKIVGIKKVTSQANLKVYVQNPLWHYELPDKDPTIMEFLDYEVLKVEDQLDIIGD